MTKEMPSPRQLLVLLLRARGYSVAQVAELLRVPSNQVQQSADSATQLLGAGDWRQAAASARQRGLIS